MALDACIRKTSSGILYTLYSIIYYVYNTQAFNYQKLVRDKCVISST